MNLFYTKPEEVRGQELIISGQESAHLVKVLRHRAGDTVHVTDGAGSLYRCRILSADPHLTRTEILTHKKKKSDLPLLTICIGLIRKKDRLEFAVEKVTEVGADRIWLFHGEHSEKLNVRKERIEKSVLAAMKQSLSCWLPDVVIFKNLEELLKNRDQKTVLVVADETTDRSDEKDESKGSGEVMLFIGPEGGFSRKERVLFEKEGASFISLGERRLRTETAALVMCDRYRNR